MKQTSNLRRRTLRVIAAAAILLAAVFAAGLMVKPERYAVDFTIKNRPPTPAHPFGTDWLGRDMFFRTLKGLSPSMVIGLFASLVSSLIAVALGVMAAAAGRRTDSFILWLVDLFQGMPHLIFLIFVCILLGRGFQGIMIGVALTHWPPLTRLIRAEIISLKNRQFIISARSLGSSALRTAIGHFTPHILPQFIVGVILMFPHAILHEAAITFLGFGIPPEEPAIGIILSEAMRYITSGYWWLAFFPGASLLVIVLLFDRLGHNLERLLNPASAQS
ncbi:MAG: ABC transporter permease [Treponema sp.]|nr:ABC transporter permease [Treponema sp.]